MNRQNQFLITLLAFNLFTFASVVLLGQIYPSQVLGVTSDNQSKFYGITNFNQFFKNFQKPGVGQSNANFKIENLENLNQLEKLQELEKLIPTMNALSKKFTSNSQGQVPCQILEPVVKQYCTGVGTSK